MTKQEFHSLYVAPCYMSLMNLNFVYKSNAEIDILINSLKNKGSELSDATLIKMLHNPWRESKVAAWIIGLLNKQNLRFELLKVLNTPGVFYNEHVLLNLLILKHEHSEHLMRFINSQIGHFMTTNSIIDLERLSIDWAISILNYLDLRNQSTHIELLKSSQNWIAFDKQLSLSRYADEIKRSFENDYYMDKILLMHQKLHLK